MPRVKIGELVVDLNQCAFEYAEYVEGGTQIRVWFQGQRFGFREKSQPEVYRALKAYMDAQETLHDYQLRQIRDEAFDPFLDEMPRTLFELFRSVPGSEKLTLTLGTDGGGHVDHMISGEQLLWWDTFDEALEKMQAFKTESK